MPGVASILAFSRLAIWSTTSFSCVPPLPIAPGSSPPCPGSRAIVTVRVFLPGREGVVLGEGGAVGAANDGAEGA